MKSPSRDVEIRASPNNNKKRYRLICPKLTHSLLTRSIQNDVVQRILHRQRVKRSDKKLAKIQKEAAEKIQAAVRGGHLPPSVSTSSFSDVTMQYDEEIEESSRSVSTTPNDGGVGATTNARVMAPYPPPSYVRVVDSLKSGATRRLVILPPDVQDVKAYLFHGVAKA